MKYQQITAWGFLLSLGVLACQTPSSPTLYTTNQAVKSPVDLVNPLMGTDSDFSLSNGNTYPAIALPWGMNFWTPMTSKMGDGWTYKYDENKIRGIKQTHQPSPWINDYAAFSLMATTGRLKFQEEERASWFSHQAFAVLPARILSSTARAFFQMRAWRSRAASSSQPS